MADGKTRIEHDSLGSVEVAAHALYGAHTARARENFDVSGITLQQRPALLTALARVKVAAALANVELAALKPRLGEAIAAAGRDVARGEWHEQFPLDVVQGGGGTSTNMNVNEVLANRGNELLGGGRGAYDPLHPNDHVNRSQSTNDVYPTALQIATIELAAQATQSFDHLAAVLERKAEEVGGMERIGRTCLRDAIPVPAGPVHRSQAAAILRTARDLAAAVEPLHVIPLGATVVGTGFGAPPGFAERAVAHLAEETALPLLPDPLPYDALAHHDQYVAVASALVRAMLVAAKLAADLRYLASSPVGEIELPAVQAGSSAMPGKVNPVMPELVIQVSYETRAAAQAVELAAASGELELNVMEPVIAKHLLGMLEVAGRTARLFADRCVAGMRWNEERIQANLEGSLAASMERAVERGYDNT